MSVGCSHLCKWYRQVFALVGGELSLAIDGAFSLLCRIVAIEGLCSLAPPHEVEEALRLHCELQPALHLHNLYSLLLVVGAGVVLAIELHAIL